MRTISGIVCAAPPASLFEDPERWERVIRMTNVDAPDHFLAGINNFLAINWRLTGKRPLVRLDVPTQLGFVKTRFKYHLIRDPKPRSA